MDTTNERERILITGSEGLIGSMLRQRLLAAGHHVVGLDTRAPGREAGDVRDRQHLNSAMQGCAGVVHLAAVSRVIWGQKQPNLCWSTNVGGIANVVETALAQPARPWVIFASSREVYGQPNSLPVSESAPRQPMNVYGRSKVEGEAIVEEGRQRGLRTAVIRFSNVYGSHSDHFDRVVPAFARAAAFGEPLRIDGSNHVFDFTHIDDAVRGVALVIDHLQRCANALPALHLATGVPTTLGKLANMAIELAGSNSTIIEAPPRSYDVSRFYGNPSLAFERLGWQAQVQLRTGLARLIQDFRELQAGVGPWATWRPTSEGVVDDTLHSVANTTIES